jgi:hypothetical protein
MWLHDFPFPPSTPLCPNAAAVLAYLKAYAAHNKIAANIRLRTRVAAACPASKGARHHWDVELVSGEVLSADLLVAASGQYHAPRLPDTAGLYAWLTSGRATHTVTYRRPDAYAGRRVLLVGAGPSGYDIREELERAGAHVVHSITGGVSSPYWPMPAPGTRVRPRAAEYRADGSVLFVDGVLEHVDCALLATGYDISFPWLDAVFRPPGAPPAVPPLPNALYNSRKHVFPLARHTWPLAGAGAPPHALAIIGLGDNVSFFPLFEAQARAVAHVFAEPQALDVERERAAVLARAEEMQRTLSPEELAKRWHEFGTDMIPFINGMNALAGDLGVPGSELPPVAAWQHELLNYALYMRNVWRKIVYAGEADEWVRDVGEGGPHEWIDLMRKVVQRGQEDGMTVYRGLLAPEHL